MENISRQITLTISSAAEIMAAVIIGAAILKLVYQQCRFLANSKNILSREKLRVEFGSAVSIALELMLGADVLGTAVAPNWSDIGKLAAIAVIRTALNYFLGKELKEIRTA